MMESFGTINNNFYPLDFRLWYKVNNKESRKRDWPCSGVFIAQMQKQPLEEFFEKVVLKKFTKFTGKHLRWSLLWNSESLQQKTSSQVFSYEFFEIFKNSYSKKYIQVTTPESLSLKCDVLPGLVPFEQLKKRGKTSMDECYFQQSATLLRASFLHSSHKWYQITQRASNEIFVLVWNKFHTLFCCFYCWLWRSWTCSCLLC